jgi:hypothetical protein
MPMEMLTRQSNRKRCLVFAAPMTDQMTFGPHGTSCRKTPSKVVCVVKAVTIWEDTRRVKYRAVNAIDQDIKLNMALWISGERIARMKA